MVYDGIVIGLIVGLIRGGFKKALAEFSQLKLKAGWVFPLLLVIQIVMYYWLSKKSNMVDLGGYVFMAVYIAGLIFLWLNRKQAGFSFIIVGVFLNFLVMILNDGRMPVSLEAVKVLDPAFVEQLNEGEISGKHAMMIESTKLPFLADIIPLTKPYPISQVISIGDIIMNVGIFIFLQHVMTRWKGQASRATAHNA